MAKISFADLGQKVRHAFRALRRNPAFTAVAVLSIGFGIGSATSMFAVIDALDFRPLPFRDADRLVWLAEVTPQDNSMCSLCAFPTALPTFHDWLGRVRAYNAVGAISPALFSWQHEDVVEPLRATAASPGLFGILGTQPILGREFVDADTVLGAQPVALLSFRFWRREFAAAPDVIGRLINTPIDHPDSSGFRTVSVVGVLPDGFPLASGVDVWIPLGASNRSGRSARVVTVIGRLAPGYTISQADSELRLISAGMKRDFPGVYDGWDARVQPLRTALGWGSGEGRFAIFAISILVAFIAMLNVAGLYVARSVARRREIATRIALGARRRHLFEQDLIEGICVGLAGAAAGILIALWGVQLAARWFNLEASGISLVVNYRAALFAGGLSVATGLFAALVPAALRDRKASAATLRERSVSDSMSASRIDSVLVGGQISTALVLLTAGVILSADYLEARHLGLGYEPQGLYTTFIVGHDRRSADPASFRLLAETARDRVAVVPGVELASIDHQSLVFPRVIRAHGNAQWHASETATPFVKAVDSLFLATWGIRLVAGRRFTSEDRRGQDPVAIVNQAAAAAFWPGQDPLGQSVFLGEDSSNGETVTVVGVVTNAERADLARRRWPVIYRPIDQVLFYHAGASLSIRTAVDRPGIIAAAEAALRQATGGPVNPFASEREALSGRLEARRLRAIVLNLFAVFGVLLAVMGVYGTISYMVSQRTREIGIRFALGARPVSVIGLIARRGLKLALFGVAAGIVGAVAVRRVLNTLVTGSLASDPLLLVGAVLLVVIVAFIATLIPAWRVVHVDPVISMRTE